MLKKTFRTGIQKSVLQKSYEIKVFKTGVQSSTVDFTAANR